MKKSSTLRGIAFAAIAGLTLTLHAQDTNDQTQFPAVVQQPVDDAIPVGASTTFSVQTTNADSYQWMLNGVPLDGQTNNSITIASVSTNDVGYYSAAVIKGSEVVPTRAAALTVVTAADLGGGGSITVFGFPVVSGGGSGSCPGPYAGFVNFTKTISQGWGWAPDTNATVLTASDDNQSNTIVQAGGKYGDTYCNQTSVTIPYPARSPKYRFTIFFPPNTQVPTNAYPITLTGFDQ